MQQPQEVIIYRSPVSYAFWQFMQSPHAWMWLTGVLVVLLIVAYSMRKKL